MLEAELGADRAAADKLTAELRECAAEESRVHARLKQRGEEVTRGEVSGAAGARPRRGRRDRSSPASATKLGLEPEPSDDAAARRRARARCTPASSACSAAASSSARSTRSRSRSTRRRSSTSRSSSASARTWRPRCASSQGLIRDTDRRIKEAFEETFAAAAKNFEEVVGHLFPGGRGSLRLVREDAGPRPVLGGARGARTDAPRARRRGERGDGPDDKLGVEIEITPAGKATKRLTLLSGGEKSMTALAFLFAVFLARPCPFYILDEVEAALDDLNIDRFLKVLRSFAGRAQFIVVTHQKRTMEAADSLYGVSMAGNGVSKVISRQLPRAVEEAAA